MFTKFAKYHLGQVVRHKKHPFRGVVFDVDPEFNNSDEWYENLPEDGRPSKEQPFYHLLAENENTFYVAYVSEQNLIEFTLRFGIHFFKSLKDFFYNMKI